MKKKKAKHNNKYLFVFPIIFLIFPPLFFLTVSVFRFFNTDTFNYFSNFFYFSLAIKRISEYLFPTVLFFVFGAFTVCIYKFFSKKQFKWYAWLIICNIGTFLILLGERILFLITNGYTLNSDVISFLINGIEIYSFTLSAELSFLICFILHFFDTKFLNK